MIFKVVATPTSDLIKTSSNSSRRSASIFDFPAIAVPNLEKKDFLEAERPLSNCSFFSGLKIDFKKLIGLPIKKATVKVAYILERC